MRVQVHLRAEKLGNIARGKWRGKKSNPYAKVELVGGNAMKSMAFMDLGATEIIDTDLSPTWTTIIIVDHNQNDKDSWTPLRITIYDSRSGSTNNKSDSNNGHHDRDNQNIQPNTILPRQLVLSNKGNNDPKMGQVDVEVGEILKLEGQEKKLKLNEGGSVFVHITESEQGNDSGDFSCHIRGLDLKNIESGLLGLGAIDPYFELSKKYTDPAHGISRWHVVYRSEHIQNVINPYWKPFRIDLERLCHCNLGKELKLAVWDQQDRGDDRWLAEVEVSVGELQKCVTRGGNANRENALRVENEEHEVMGLLVVLKAEVILL